MNIFHKRRRRPISGVFELRAGNPTRQWCRIQNPEVAGSTPAQRTARATEGPTPFGLLIELFPPKTPLITE